MSTMDGSKTREDDLGKLFNLKPDMRIGGMGPCSCLFALLTCLACSGSTFLMDHDPHALSAKIVRVSTIACLLPNVHDGWLQDQGR